MGRAARALIFMHLLSPAIRASIRRRLRTWFSRHARALPWRASRDPYRIWISEVMLQQTQVATVIPYFQRFLEKLPTLDALAQADEQTVLRLWEGLGYYRRARDLHRAARQLVALKHTTIPEDADLLRTLPGFGRYTVNAVLSQAYDRSLPIVEANSRRVLCRLFAIDQDPTRPAVDQLLWKLAAALLPRKGAGDFNQALMELGALVCVPTAPRCEQCPLQHACQARLQGRQGELPVRSKRAEAVLVEEVAVVVRQEDAVLLVQRPAEGRWGAMWEMPHQVRTPKEPPIKAARRLLAALGIEGEITREIMTLRHNVTRFQITMVCFEVMHRSGQPAQGVWVQPDQLDQYPLSRPQRALADWFHIQSATPTTTHS